jgi:hypothetical protein
MAQYVGQSASEHAHLALEGSHAAKAGGMVLLGGLLFDQDEMVALALDKGKGREGLKCFG